MLFWTRFPFIRITLFFISGILFYQISNISPDKISVLLLIIFPVYILLNMMLRRKLFHKNQYILSILMFLNLSVLGFLRTGYNSPENNPDHWIHHQSSIDSFVARIINNEGRSKKYSKYTARVIFYHNDTSWKPTEGKIMLYTPPKNLYIPGDVVMIKGTPRNIDPPLLPGQFDYKQFMARKRIFGILFLQENQIFYITHKTPGIIKQLAYQAGNSITQIINRSQNDKDVRAILTALLTGDRDKIDPDTYDTFIDVGVVHILAVSGLHVGIIYMICLILLKPAGNNLWGRLLRMLFILSILLLFVFMTGLSPSVLRASVMFSIMLIGKTLQRNSHTINTVFFSAFILLLIDPLLIYNVGFQLSYAAVLGIILFQPLLVKLWSPDHPILEWIWKLSSVSMAAQLSTLPITLLYFKQFPSYFLLSNLMAIPYASFVIPLGLSLIPLHNVEFINLIISYLLKYSTDIFIFCMNSIRAIPGSLIYPVNINISEVAILFIILVLLYLIMYLKKWKLVFVCFFLIFSISASDAWSYFRNRHNKKIVNYRIPGFLCFELIDGNKGIIISDPKSEGSIKKIKYYTDNNCISENHPATIFSLDEINQVLPCIFYNDHYLIIWNKLVIKIVSDENIIAKIHNNPTHYDLIISPDSVIINPVSNIISQKKATADKINLAKEKGYVSISWTSN